jgi:hypothetical protein
MPDIGEAGSRNQADIACPEDAEFHAGIPRMVRCSGGSKTSIQAAERNVNPPDPLTGAVEGRPLDQFPP